MINEHQLEHMLAAVERAKAAGATVLTGGERLDRPGFYIAPTIVEGADARHRALLHRALRADHHAPPSRRLRGGARRRERQPVRADGGDLDASIHRGQEFVRRVVAGGVQVNGPTYGFEPHVPFGGQSDSGTGWREPGTEALDVYSDWKTVYVTHDPASV